MRLQMIVRLCGVFLGFLLPSIVWANIGPQWRGDRAAEPLGLKGVAILREQLTIDLRPLAAVQPVVVEAVYNLNNSGSAKTLNLLFITGVTGVSDFEVRLDGRLVESRRVPIEQLESQGELPKSWQPPKDMPGFDSKVSHSHFLRHRRDTIMLAFTLELPPGRSTLSARYRARAYGEDESYPTVTWGFPYILAPAREWGSFGGLDVTVYLPQTWQSNSIPALEREGGILRGSFTNLPADCLALVVRAPWGQELQQKLRSMIWFYVALYVFVVISGGILCWRAGRFFGGLLVQRARPGTWVRKCPVLWAVPLALLLTAAWDALNLGVTILALNRIYGVFAGQKSPYFHEDIFAPFGPFSCNLCFMLFVLPAGFMLALDGARRSLLHAEPRP